MNDDYPWWFYRCTHRSHGYEMHGGQEFGCWRVLREAEGVAILELTCLHQVHVLVELDGAGSVCKTLKCSQYEALSEQEIMALVQQKRRELRSLLA